MGEYEYNQVKRKLINQENIINAYRDYIEMLTKRLSHLCQSEFIKAFDEMDNRTGKYLIDINVADRIAKEGLKNLTEYAINIGTITIE